MRHTLCLPLLFGLQKLEMLKQEDFASLRSFHVSGCCRRFGTSVSSSTLSEHPICTGTPEHNRLCWRQSTDAIQNSGHSGPTNSNPKSYSTHNGLRKFVLLSACVVLWSRYRSFPAQEQRLCK